MDAVRTARATALGLIGAAVLAHVALLLPHPQGPAGAWARAADHVGTASFLALLLGLAALAAWGGYARRGELVWAGAGGLFGLAVIGMFSIGVLILPFALAIAGVAVAKRRTMPITPLALASAALAIVAAPALVLGSNLGSALLDPCYAVEWRTGWNVEGSSTMSPDGPCSRGGVHYATTGEVLAVAAAPALALATWWAVRAGARPVALAVGLALAALAAFTPVVAFDAAVFLAILGPAAALAVAGAWRLQEKRAFA